MLKSQDFIIKKMGDKLDLLQSQITQNNREDTRKLDKVLNILKGGPTNGIVDHATVDQNEFIEIIPDSMRSLKPKLTDKNIVIATYEYLINPTKDSFDLLSATDKNVQKHLIQKLSIMSDMISGIILLGYPKYSSNMNRNEWRIS